METDFLNFHDEEHFGSALYQNELLDDSQGSLLDIVGDDYSRQDSSEYLDNSVIWDHEVEREINGDVAVIPMSSSINSFPKLSNSPPTKDIQRILCDWQEQLASIEASDAEDLSVDLQLQPNYMLDYINPNLSHSTITSEITSIDSSQIQIPKIITPKSSPKPINFPTYEKKEIKLPTRPGGKNLALLKQVVKEQTKGLDLDTSFKSESSVDEFDSDNFDITSYVCGPDFDKNKQEDNIKQTKNIPDKSITLDKTENYKNVKKEPEKQKPIDKIDPKNIIEDEEDHIDVETVSEPSEMPVLEAGDVCSLLEQFEATEAVNPKPTQNVIDEKTEPKKNKLINKNIRDALPIELIQKIKASGHKKSISVIPAIPKKNRRSVEVRKIKLSNESVQLDHDYCVVSPSKISRNQSRRNSSDSDTRKKSPERTDKIDDTAVRIEKQIKNVINKQKSILKYQPTIKNNGKLMVSLLKTNRNINVTNSDEVKNIANDAESKAKKRKLNLEEYKRLRGEILKSCENSGTNTPNSGMNSPMPQDQDEKIRLHQELMMKMASEILKTPAKSNKPVCEAKLEEFVPPEVKKKEIKIEPEILTPKIPENYEVITIVSIGVNTELIEQEPEVVEEVKKEPVEKKLKEIAPILQNCNTKISSNSLITALLQKSNSPKYEQKSPKPDKSQSPDKPDPWEDKTVIVLNKTRPKPDVRSIETQTDFVEIKIEEEEKVEKKEKIGKTKEKKRQYRSRRDSSASSSCSNSSSKCKSTVKNGRESRRQSHRTSSSNSLSSSLGSRWSRSRSRSRSRSHSVYSQSSYYSVSSRSRSRSLSPERRWSRNSRSRHRYSRRRTRSRSRSNDYRNYRRSRSYSRSRSRKRRELEQEKLKEVEERRVIYVGKISDGTSKADLRRRFESFGPITNVSVHFRDIGDNYGFVTFAYKVDAYRAVEHGNDDPHVPKYDISFGGRRAFCKTRYSDLDNIEAESMNPVIFRREEDSFDILLREAQAKLRKRKV